MTLAVTVLMVRVLKDKLVKLIVLPVKLDAKMAPVTILLPVMVEYNVSVMVMVDPVREELMATTFAPTVEPVRVE